MTDFFVSYAREDQEFVRRLHAELERRGREVWVDWESIPPTADWLARITEAIRDANAFVFVVSPDSVSSPVCRQELGRAAELNKRILPLQLRDVDGMELPDEVARINWIPFGSGDGIAAGVGTLLEAADTDLPWVEEHNRWLREAEEWQSGQQRTSSLARGQELAAASAWLRRGLTEHKDPAPTPLQSEFILASQRNASRRQRMGIGVVGVGLLIAIGLALLAFTQRNEARSQREAATSRELSANAVLQLQDDPELSVLLASRAVKVRATAQAVDALRQALARSRVRAAVRPGSDVASVAFSPDGRQLLTGQDDGGSALWDARTGRLQARLTRHRQPGQLVYRVLYSPDASQVATLAQDGYVRLSDPRTGRLLASIHDTADRRLLDMAYSPDGRRLATSNFHTAARIWDTATGRELVPLASHPTAIDSIAFSPDGRRVLMSGQDATAWIDDARTGAEVATLRGHAPPYVNQALYSPDGRTIATAGEDRTVRLWTARGALRAVLPGHTAAVRHLAFSRDGTLLASAGDDRTARIWRVSDGASLATLTGHTADVTDLRFSPDGQVLATGSGDATVRLWEAHSGRLIDDLRGHQGGVTGIDFSPDGRLLASASSDGSARVWSASPTGGAFSLAAARRAPSVEKGAFSPGGGYLMVEDALAPAHVMNVLTGARRDVAPPRSDLSPVAGVDDRGSRVVFATQTGDAELVDVSSGRTLGRLRGHHDFLTAAGFSPDGRWVATAGNDERVIVYDARTGAVRHVLRGHGRRGQQFPFPINSVRFSADSRRLVSSSDDGTARVWDVGSGHPIQVLRLQTPPDAGMYGGSSAAFAPSGKRIVTTVQWDLKTWVWDLGRNTPIAQLAGNEGAPTDAAFSPDGGFIVTGAFDGTTRIWVTGSAQQLAVLRPLASAPAPSSSAQTDPIRAVSFVGGGGRQVAALGRTSLRIYDCEVCRSTADLLALASKRVTRPLTPTERLIYLHQR